MSADSRSAHFFVLRAATERTRVRTLVPIPSAAAWEARIAAWSGVGLTGGGTEFANDGSLQGVDVFGHVTTVVVVGFAV